MIRSSILDSDFNIQFPYATLPWRLEVNKDHHNVKGIALTVCHFECEEHLQKYLDRYRLKPKDYQVSNPAWIPLETLLAMQSVRSDG